MRDVVLTSGRQIRERLGAQTLVAIRDLDPYRHHRSQTAAGRRRLIARLGNRCAHCHSGDRLEAAHIVPLEIGAATTDDNLIILCQQCHRRYDAGHLSIRDMQRLAVNWRSGSSGPRAPLAERPRPTPSITPPPKSVAGVLAEAVVLQRECKFLKAVQSIEAALIDPTLDSAGRAYLSIKRAELIRRRSAGDAVQRAIALLEAISPDEIPAAYRPVLCYELMYAYRLDGRQKDALHTARKGTAAVRDMAGATVSVDFVAARVNEILCELSLGNRLAASEAAKLRSELAELEDAAATVGGYWGGRWALNCAAHAVQVRLKSGDPVAISDEVTRFRELYYISDTATGWDIGARQSVSLLEGQVRVACPESASDPAIATGLLARSLLSRLGTRQRPEGVRDAGFALSQALKLLGGRTNERLASGMEDVLEDVVDGTSVIWPYNRVA